MARRALRLARKGAELLDLLEHVLKGLLLLRASVLGHAPLRVLLLLVLLGETSLAKVTTRVAVDASSTRICPEVFKRSDLALFFWLLTTELATVALLVMSSIIP